MKAPRQKRNCNIKSREEETLEFEEEVEEKTSPEDQPEGVEENTPDFYNFTKKKSPKSPEEEFEEETSPEEPLGSSEEKHFRHPKLHSKEASSIARR